MQKKISTQNNKLPNSLPRVCFILPYFGKWPVWTPLFLESCSQNKGFTWLLFGNQKGLKNTPTNVKWQKMTLKEFNKLAKYETKLPFEIRTPYKVCDAKPMYGDIFKKYLAKYQFWGYTDLDIIYGDLNSFSVRKKLLKYDIYFPYNTPVGHFTIFKNTPKINSLYHNFPSLKLAYTHSPNPLSFDEKKLELLLKNNHDIKFHRSFDYHAELSKTRCSTGASIMHCGQLIRENLTARERYLYSRGKTFQLNGSRKREFMYFHFFTWKNDKFWRRFKKNRKLPYEFWMDESGFLDNAKDLLQTNYTARILKMLKCAGKLSLRGLKYYYSTQNLKRRII